MTCLANRHSTWKGNYLDSLRTNAMFIVLLCSSQVNREQVVSKSASDAKHDPKRTHH